MRLRDNCSALRRLIQDIQILDPAYAAYGEAYPEFDSGWDDKLFSVLYIKFGSTSLKQKFLAALERRFCRRNYQQTVDMLEELLDDALRKHGQDKIIALAEKNPQIAALGPEIVPALQEAGIIFTNPDRLNILLRKAHKRAMLRLQATDFCPEI